MTIFTKRVIPFIALLLGVSACGGGGGGSASPSPAKGTPTSGSLTLSIPPATSSAASTARKVRDVSPSAESVTVTAQGYSTTQTFDVSATSKYCVAGASARTCTLPITALTGSDVITVTVYDGANGTGNVLGSGTATVNVTPGFTTTITISTSLSTVSVSVGTGFLGVSGAVPITVSATDVDGNPVSGSFAAPVTLSDSDTSGATSLSTTTVTSTTQAVSLNYKGGALSGPVTITASASGAKSATATFTVNDDDPLVNGSTATFNTNLISTVTAEPSGSQSTYGGDVTNTYTLQTGQTFNGVSGLDAVATTMNLTASGQTIPITDTTYLLPALGTSTLAIEQAGENISTSVPVTGGSGSTTLVPVTITEVPTAPYAITDLLPHAPGTISPASAATTDTITGQYMGSTATLTFAQQVDGSYTLSGNAGYGGATASFSVTENADGSGSGTFTDSAPLSSSGPPYKGSFTYPVPGSGTTIPVSYTIQATSSSSPQTVSTTVPNWLVLNSVTLPNPLLSTQTTDKGTVSLPGGCSGLSTPANDVETVQSRTDTMLGLVITSTTDDYTVAGVGTVCRVSNYTVNVYDSLRTGSLESVALIGTVSTLSSSSLSATSSAHTAGHATFLPGGLFPQARALGAQAILNRVAALAAAMPH